MFKGLKEGAKNKGKNIEKDAHCSVLQRFKIKNGKEDIINIQLQFGM